MSSAAVGDRLEGALEVDQIVHADGLDRHAQLGRRILRFIGAQHHARIGVSHQTWQVLSTRPTTWRPA